ESTIPLNEINSQIPPSILITTSPPILPTEDPEDSLIMRNEDLSTIPKKESNEFIKSSVENLVVILTVTFSNPLFNSNDDFTSSDDESLSDEDVPEDNVNIYSNPLFEFDDEFLVTPLSDANKDECFDLGGDDVEINVLDFEDREYYSLNEINSQIPPSIVITTSPPILPTEDPEDSLIMRNDDLSTIPKKESNEFIKSSVENLVVILRGDDVEINVLDFEDSYHDSEGDISILRVFLMMIKFTVTRLFLR
nr:hypothetical protein [Tanacetum cinerariifolium]